MESGSSAPQSQRSFDRVQALIKSFDRRRLAHALLFVDQNDPLFRNRLGRFIKNLFCYERFKKGVAEACGYCDSCLILSEPVPSSEELGSRHLSQSEGQAPLEEENSQPLWLHPDFVWLYPDSTKGYTLDPIKELQSRFSLKPSLSDIRIAWIERAEDLSSGGAAPANALLKLLEEPRPNTYLILSTSQAGRVLPTLQSRCQKFIFWNEEAPLSDPKSIDWGDWNPFFQWLMAGAPQDQMIRGWGPDQDTFWKNRDQALTELHEYYERLWNQLTQQWNHFDRQASYRLLDVFQAFEECLRALKNYGQPQLQWLNFRETARLGFVKNANY